MHALLCLRNLQTLVIGRGDDPASGPLRALAVNQLSVLTNLREVSIGTVGDLNSLGEYEENPALEGFPAGLCLLPKLLSLCLNSYGVTTLPSAVTRLTSLRRLHLSVRTLPSDAPFHLASLTGLVSLNVEVAESTPDAVAGSPGANARAGTIVNDSFGSFGGIPCRAGYLLSKPEQQTFMSLDKVCVD
ncbi:hypothetical protein WJX72_008326 [[Myrmecia] bisecta]|uniref:Uncharacterized protein n=1 Tax=[Myrmecia] bisecta TaxID=41462 RepID=A0AAW1PBX1_9CHLO